jgi:CheY-like chemotaxis protein
MWMSVSVLVVDDDLSFREAVGELLSVRGFDVVGYAGDEDEAVSAVRQLRPDAVLLDIGLPGRDGFEVARRFSGCDHRPAVLLTSSNALAANQALALQCGAVGFVAKTHLATADLGRYLAS